MLSETNRACLLFFGIVSSAILCVESGLVDRISHEQIPIPEQTRDEIDIAPIDEPQLTGPQEKDQEGDSKLQKRDWMSSIFSGPSGISSIINNNGVSRGHGNGAIIIGDTVIPGGASNFQSVSYSGRDLDFDKGNVHVTVHSPKRNVKIEFRGKRAFVNRKLVSKDIYQLDDEPRYQKSADGALWYTNLPVGEEMTEKEIEEFNEEDQKVEEEKKRVLKEAQEHTEHVLREAEKTRAAAMEQARRAIVMANSFWGPGWGWGW